MNIIGTMCMQNSERYEELDRNLYRVIVGVSSITIHLISAEKMSQMSLSIFPIEALTCLIYNYPTQLT